MDFQGLQAALARSGTTVTVATDSLGGAFSGFLGKYYVGQGKQLQIDDAEVTLDEASRAVSITGRAGFLEVANLPVKATFSLDEQGKPVAVVTYTLRDRSGSLSAWKFSASFPEIPIDPSMGTGDLSVPLLDMLSLTEASFVVASRKHTDPATRVELAEGISFLGQLMPLGLIGALDSVLGGIQAIPLHGTIRIPFDETDLPATVLGKDLSATRTYPWELSPTLPGIHLEAPIGGDLSLGKLKLKDARFRLYSPLSWLWVSGDDVFAPLLAVTGTLDIPSAGISVEVITTAQSRVVASGVELGVFVEAKCSGLSIGNLAHLADLAGPGDLSSGLPDELSAPVKALAKLSLLDVAFSMSAGAQGLSLTSSSVGIGLPGCRWRVWGNHVEVTDIGARFTVLDPMGGASVLTDLWGTTLIEGAPVEVKASKYSGGFALAGKMKEKETLPLKQLMKAYLPAVPPPADLTIDDLRVSVDSDGFQLSGALAQKPDSWKLAVGPGKLELSDLVFDCVVPKSGATMGMFRGTIGLGKDVTLAMAYTTPGNFAVRADCKKVALGQLIAQLANQKAFLPAGFDINLLDSSVLIEDKGGSLRFQLATRVDGMGCLAFEAKNVGGGQWGFAAGLDLGAASPSALPGLSALAAFEKAARIQKLALVVASYDNAQFQFPDLAQFNNRLIGTGKVSLPSQSGGLRSGFNFFGEWRVDTGDKAQGLLAKLLGLDGSIGVTMQVSKDTARMFVRRDAKIAGQPMSCEVGLMSPFGPGVVPAPSWYLTGSLTMKIQGSPQTFDVTTAFVPTGAFLSATMKGNAPVDCKLFKLSNLALEIGVSWAGVPSLGLAATIDVKSFESSIAVFFDSSNPAQSLLAGAVSDLSLKDVADTLLGGALPSSVDEVLKTVNVKGTQSFKIPGDLADELDSREVAKIAAAFSSSGKVQIPSSTDQVLLCTNKKGAVWHLTDLTKMRHYALKKSGNDIEVSVEAQFYFAPQPTMVGSIRFPQGYYLNGAVEFFGFRASATINIAAYKGFSIDAQMDKIVIGNENVFSIAAAKGGGGPQLSISTMAQPEHAVAEFRLPHFYINGKARLLGLEVVAYANVTVKGILLELKGPLAPGVTFDLDAQLGGSDLAVDGDIKVGIGTIDLGELGKIKVNTDVEGSLGVRVSGAKIDIAVDGSFSFMGSDVDLGRFTLEPSPDALAKLASKVTDKVAQQLREIFKDVSRWTKAMSGDLVEGVQDTEKVLKNVYKKSDKEAKELAKSAGKAAGDAGKAVEKTANKFGKKIKKLF